MKNLAGKTAVVTGAASGIGRALAERFVAEDMAVVLADVDRERLDEAASELRGRGGRIVSSVTDVSRAEEVKSLASLSVDTFGSVHVLCNNAGLATPPAPSWEKPLEDWELVLGVNLWGVIHGVREFLPLLLDHGEEGHVVNTASAAGLIYAPHGADYFVSKHGVVALSESLFLELQALESKIGVSVLCPGFVRTNILDAIDERFADRKIAPEMARASDQHRKLLADSMQPEEIAEQVVAAIRAERLYVLPHPEIDPYIESRARHIISRENPDLNAE
jgi:NAD(P)-dependent dehydrogenase (short-subunit alcohol dehydrogenase family)